MTEKCHFRLLPLHSTFDDSRHFALIPGVVSVSVLVMDDALR
jgi:hypothetical protein